MPRYVTSVRTPWTAPRAFAYLSDLTHFADWDPGVTHAVQVIGDGPGNGASFDVTVKSAMSKMTLRYETVIFEPPQRIEVVAQTASLRSYDVMTFEDLGDKGCLYLHRGSGTTWCTFFGEPAVVAYLQESWRPGGGRTSSSP